MSFCGANFSDQFNEDCKAFDHGLRNVVRCNIGLLVRDEEGRTIDQRTKIVFKDKKFWGDSFGNIVQMKVKLPSGEYSVGSGSLSCLHDYRFVITAAHNLADFSAFYNSMVKFKRGYAYRKRQGLDEWDEEYEIDVKNAFIHPNYDGNTESGFDIACSPLLLKSPKKRGVNLNKSTMKYGTRKIDYMWWYIKPHWKVKGLKIEVVGYPGELKGYPYYHKGQIVKSLMTKAGGWLIYYDVDCTPGNSGSPIYVTDQTWIKQYYPGNVEKIAIGIHVGHDHLAGLNFGTLLTKAMFNWIEKQSTNW